MKNGIINYIISYNISNVMIKIMGIVMYWWKVIIGVCGILMISVCIIIIFSGTLLLCWWKLLDNNINCCVCVHLVLVCINLIVCVAIIVIIVCIVCMCVTNASV